MAVYMRDGNGQLVTCPFAPEPGACMSGCGLMVEKDIPLEVELRYYCGLVKRESGVLPRMMKKEKC